MKGFTPTAKDHGFSSDLLWSGLRSGCCAPPASRIMIGLHSSSQHPLLPKTPRQSTIKTVDKKDGEQEARQAGFGN